MNRFVSKAAIFLTKYGMPHDLLKGGRIQAIPWVMVDELLEKEVVSIAKSGAIKLIHYI
jgi:hypothetical protein